MKAAELAAPAAAGSQPTHALLLASCFSSPSTSRTSSSLEGRAAAVGCQHRSARDLKRRGQAAALNNKSLQPSLWPYFAAAVAAWAWKQNACLLGWAPAKRCHIVPRCPIAAPAHL